MGSFNSQLGLPNECLNAFLLLPVALLLLCFAIPKAIQRAYALVGALLLFAVSLYECGQGEGEQTLTWLSDFGIQLSCRFDSVSKWFLLSTALVTLVAVSLKGTWYRKYPRVFVANVFFLVFALNLAFLSTNLVTFYFAYEAVFVPMIFMVGIWGTRAKASSVLRFFLMSFVGSILMLVSIFYLIQLYHARTGQYSAQLYDLIQVSKTVEPSRLCWAFFGFFLAFAIKVPLVPFHGWLKEVYVNAPMPATLFMSGSLSKLGVFGFLRFVLPLFGEQAIVYHSFLVTIATVSVLYAAFLALQSKNPKELLSYSSISHLGFVMLGVFSLTNGGAGAAVLLSVGHTLASVLLFAVLHFIQERKEDLALDHFHGLAKKYPVLFTSFFIGILASVSLPGTLNFIGEFMVLTFSYPVSAPCTLLSCLGVVLGAVYLLKLYQFLGFGTAPAQRAGDGAAHDIGVSEMAILALMIGLVIYLGFQPSVILKGFGS